MQRPVLDTNSLNVPVPPPPTANLSQIKKKRKNTKVQKQNSVLTKNTPFLIAFAKNYFLNLGRFSVNDLR